MSPSSRISCRSSSCCSPGSMVLLAFFILAIQLFVTLIEFKLTTLAGFVLIPFGLFGKTAFLAERVLGNVISSGVKVLVLAVIVGIGSTLFSQFTAGFGGASRPSTGHGDRAGRAVAARARHLRSRDRQRPRLRRSAAWRRRRCRNRARRRRLVAAALPRACLWRGARWRAGAAGAASRAELTATLGAPTIPPGRGVRRPRAGLANAGAQPPSRRCSGHPREGRQPGWRASLRDARAGPSLRRCRVSEGRASSARPAGPPAWAQRMKRAQADDSRRVARRPCRALRRLPWRRMLPSTFPRRADVQTIFHSLRPHAASQKRPIRKPRKSGTSASARPACRPITGG